MRLRVFKLLLVIASKCSPISPGSGLLGEVAGNIMNYHSNNPRNIIWPSSASRTWLLPLGTTYTVNKPSSRSQLYKP